MAFRTICQLAGKAAAIERAFAAGEVACLAGGFTGAGRFNRLVDDLSSNCRVLFEIRAQSLIHERLHDAGDVGIQLAFGLSFKLRLRQLHADDRDQAFAHVVASKIFFYILEQAHLLPGIVDGSGKRHAEAGEVRTSIDGVDVVGEAEH